MHVVIGAQKVDSATAVLKWSCSQTVNLRDKEKALYLRVPTDSSLKFVQRRIQCIVFIKLYLFLIFLFLGPSKP